jgi:hypothetical protein
MSALGIQVGGDHYKKCKIQPVEYIHGNNIPFIEGCVIKYISRWRDKGGVADLEKAKHFINLLIELEQNGTDEKISNRSTGLLRPTESSTTETYVQGNSIAVRDRVCNIASEIHPDYAYTGIRHK